MKIGIARLYTKSGNIKYNFKQVELLYQKAVESELEILIFPRLAISGFSVRDSFLNDEFLEKILKYFEKVLDLTIYQKTKILIGNIYYEKNYQENNNIYKSILRDSSFFIDNGYIDTYISRKMIDKSNILGDYRYFDRNNVLEYFNYNKKKFAVLLSDDIFSNFNVFLTTDNKPNYIICLDSSTRDINFREKHLLKLAKFSNSPVFYINSSTSHNGNLFRGEMILINEDFKIIHSDIYGGDEIFEFEIDCEDGSEVFIKNKKEENKKLYFLLKKKFGDGNIILDYDEYKKDEIKDIKKYSKDCVIVSFLEKKIDGVKNINIADYININIYNELDEYEKIKVRDIILCHY
jgi:predicted amidohydrolase